MDLITRAYKKYSPNKNLIFSNFASSMLTYNIDSGFIDGIIRGYKLGLITKRQYSSLIQCSNLEGLHASIHNKSLGYKCWPPIMLHTSSRILSLLLLRASTKGVWISTTSSLNLSDSIRQDVSPSFWITLGLPSLVIFSYGYMIDNVILIISGTLHERDISELLSKCHPIGMFDGIEALTTSTNPFELYQTVLIATPLGWIRLVALTRSTIL